MQAERWQAAEDDRPYLRSSRRSYTALMVVIGIAALASAGYYWHYFSRSLPVLPSGTVPATVDAQTSPQPASVAAVPRVIPVPPEAATSLPSLENSDALLRPSIAGLIGNKAFADLVIPNRLVQRIVATVDTLPRATAPTRVWPLNPVQGGFLASGSDGDTSMDPQNATRYAPYVRVLDAVDMHALVQSYVAAYPLFQKAYEQLGYPGQYFNDRLLEAID